MSNYHRIDGCNMVNGRGIRTVIWLSGCPHHCKGCFSPQTSFTMKDVLVLKLGMRKV